MKKILIVDDSQAVRELVEVTLSESNYQFHYASNGNEAVEKATEVIPDLILLDIMMPKMNGLDACAAIKKNPTTKDIPVLMLTAKGQLEDIQCGHEVGAAEYFVKPFSPLALLEKINALLKNDSR